MTDNSGFTIDVDHNEYMSEGDTTVDAIVTVTSDGGQISKDSGDPSAVAQIIMIDRSGSMTGSRIANAKQATCTAIDALPDGVQFAIIAGSVSAQMVYPTENTVAIANVNARREAKHAVKRLQAGGGTAMGNWLALANKVFLTSTADIKRGLLLTDGYNQHESSAELQANLNQCKGKFVCDACGIGDDWNATEVRLIADQLLGEGAGLPEPEQWASRFTDFTAAAMAKTVGDLTLRVFAPTKNTIRFVKQMNPTIVDLTNRRSELDNKTGDYPTGAWGSEAREFHISVQVPPISTGDDRLAARVSVLSSGVELARGLITARWTGDAMLSTKLNPKVAHYTGQADLAADIQEGVAAAKAGDIDVATNKLGKAARLAAQSGNEGTAKLLAKVIDFDAATGTARMKSQVNGIDLEMADVESVKTVTVRKINKTDSAGAT